MKEQGTSGMSVDAVVTRAGLSKGTFFHFFPTKRQFLTALCHRLADISWEETAADLNRADTDPVARANLLFASIRQWRTARSLALGALWRELAREENAALRSLVVTRWSERLGVALTGLIESGNAIGVMRVADPQVVGALIAEWVAASTLGSLRLVMERPDLEVIELAVRRTNVTVESIERVLGLAEQSLTRTDPSIVTSLAEAMQQAERVSPRMDHEVRTAAPSRRNS
jgi:TetR/AcrR family transcriptional repressor of nem operon